jgi:branched-chain amino acid aminotransferase
MLYFNDKIISSPDNCISANDRGFLLGDGLFETLRCYQGKPFALAAHWQRLCNGADYLGLTVPVTLLQLQDAITKLIPADADQAIGLRITLTRGPGPRGIIPPEQTQPTLLIQTFPLDINTTPVKACVSDIIINERSPLCAFKTLNYLDKIIAIKHAKQTGFNEAILLNTRNKIVSATTANIFIVKNKKIYTPPLTDGALSGITRKKVIKLAEKIGISCEEKSLLLEDLHDADEIFITNSLIEIRAIQQIANHWQLEKSQDLLINEFIHAYRMR